MAKRRRSEADRERDRARKARLRSGVRILPVPVHFVTWSEKMVDLGFLRECDVDDFDAVVLATENFMADTQVGTLDDVPGGTNRDGGMR